MPIFEILYRVSNEEIDCRIGGEKIRAKEKRDNLNDEQRPSSQATASDFGRRKDRLTSTMGDGKSVTNCDGS